MGKPQPVLAPPFPFTDDQLVMSITAWAGHPNYQVSKGAKLRANHPAVQNFPRYFIDANASDDEVQRAVQAIEAERDINYSHRPVTAPLPVFVTRTPSSLVAGFWSPVTPMDLGT